jgi:hypothetical protein
MRRGHEADRPVPPQAVVHQLRTAVSANHLGGGLAALGAATSVESSTRR